ncbi:MAG: hypothetical protein ACRDP7_16555 [Trebonia sp.]
MQTQALPAVHLGNREWHRPARSLGFRSRLARASRTDRPAQPVLLRRARLIALAVGGFLLPWCVVLTVVLPATAQAQHWALAWTGLDGAEAAAALMTAVLLSRGDRRAALSASAGGTLLLLDAWFDVCTSAPGTDHAMALAEASFIEIPLAIAAWWLAVVLTRETR